MQLAEARLLLSPSDLNNFMECEHLTWLDFQHARGRLALDSSRSEMAELLAGKGVAHEHSYVESLRQKGVEVLSLAEVAERDLAAAHTATRAAMARGTPVIYQAALVADGWRGLADFLVRVEEPSKLGAWSYEVADTKLARRTKPHFLLQLSFYSEQVAAVQGREPERMHLILGSKQRESYRTAEFDAYYRALRRRLERAVEGEGEEIYPLPVEHCGICRWAENCRARWQADDYLTLVANIRHDQIARLESEGIDTLAALGRAPDERRPRRISLRAFRGLRHQAALQLRGRERGRPEYELLPPEPGRGFALLPKASPGDLFFDLEGDPYFADGLEYLFGVGLVDGDQPVHLSRWAHDAAEEKRAFEWFMDFVAERRRRFPDLHVYHYAHYEPTALKRLAGRFATREEELDDLLRHHVLVDLYQVLRQGMRVSLADYSLKSVEVFFDAGREGEVTDAGESIVCYERWLEDRADWRLPAIERYNEQDCRSTRLLRDWLAERAEESLARDGQPSAAPGAATYEISDKRREEMAEVRELSLRLTAGLPGEGSVLSPEQRARRLLSYLLDYHRREERPTWWNIYDLCGKHADELIDEPEAIGGLVATPGAAPEREKSSLVYTFDFPAQETKLKLGRVFDPATVASAGEIVALDLRERTLRLKRGPTLANAPLPRALIAAEVYSSDAQRAALRRLAALVAAIGCEADGPCAAARGVLAGSPPRVRGIAGGQALHGEVVDLDVAWHVVSSLDRSHLFIQGPPGSGKTWLGARLIVRLLAENKRVGVTATSHKAIHNLLHEVEEVAEATGVRFRGLKKASGTESRFESRLARSSIENTEDNAGARDPRYQLVAGTSWLFSRAELEGSFDHLFYDEAGQIALADALASATAAKNVVLLGDPQQLAQVLQADHPEGSGASVLEHLLGERQTVPSDRGLFLSRTRRLHPDVCAFVSELSYEGRLGCEDGCVRQWLADGEPGALGGMGLRYLAVPHRGNSQCSEEEAQAVVRAFERLLGRPYRDRAGNLGALGLEHILVVAAYNMQVAKLVELLPRGARVGTVDKFQGQQAPVVFYSMATSSGDDIPRGLEFLMSRNRLNVAVSRAQCLAVLVASPSLLTTRCRSVEQMKLVNALCRFVEMAPRNA